MESLRAALLFLAVINLCSEPCFTVSTTTTGKVTTTISSAGNKNNEDPVPTNIVTTTISPAGNKNNQDPVPTTTGSSAQNLAVTTKGPTRTTAGSSAQNFAVTTKGSTRTTADQTTKATILETVTQAISTASSRNIEQNTSDGINITTNYTHTTQIPAVSTAKKTDAGNKISRDGKHKVVTYVPTDKPRMSTVDFDINSGNNGDQPASEAKNSKANPKGIIMVVCIVLAVIVSIVIVAFLYKMCKRKPPAVENTGAKTSAQNKENVKLISVKTSPQESDGKRTSHNSQMDMFAEC